MTSRLGGNIEQLQQLNSQLRRESQAVQALRSNLTSMISNTDWEGPAAQRFKGEWQSQYSQSLQKLEAALEELGQEVQRRREALIQASA